jgi:glutathione S-transferase
MSLKIHAFPLSPRNFKVLFVANHLGLDYEFVFCDLRKGAQKEAAYAAINLNQKAPALEDGAFKLWESNAIIQYLASKKPGELSPLDDQGRCDVLRWQFWESTTWDAALAILAFERFVKGLFGMGPPDAAEVEKGLAKFNAAARILDTHLRGRDYIAGDRLSLADFSIAAGLTLAEPAQLPLDSYAEIRRWGERMKALPAWKATLAMQQAPAEAA